MTETADEVMDRLVRAHASPEFCAAYFVRKANDAAKPQWERNMEMAVIPVSQD